MIKKTFFAFTALLMSSQLNAQQNALDFDGVNDYVNLDVLASPMSGSNDQIIQMWIQCDMTEQSNVRTTFFAINDQFGGNKLIFDVGGPYLQQGRFMIYNSTGNVFTSSTIIGDNQCHHILYVRSNNYVRIYIDGIYENYYYSNLTLTSTDRYSLGQEWDNTTPSDFYNGSIDEFSIWNASYSPIVSGLPASINNTYTGSEPGLVGYYKFDQGVPGANNTLINYLSDYSTPAYIGTLNNFTLNGWGSGTAVSNWINGGCFQDSSDCYNGNEISLDGVNDYINVDNIAGPLTGSTSFTIEFWMHADFTLQNSVRTALFAVNDATGNTNKFMLWLGGFSSQTGQLVVTDLGAWGTQNDFISTQVIGDTVCHHIAYSRSGNTGSIYIDGNLVGTHTISYSFAATDVFSLGQEYDNGLVPSQFYNGNIDEFRLWNTVRTPAQIAANMSAPIPVNEPGLVTYYNFNQGIASGYNVGGTAVYDVTSGYNGQLVNLALNGASSNWVAENCVTCTPVTSPPPSGNRSQIIADDNQPAQFGVYPNPATNQVTIQYLEELSENATVSVLDGRGAVVMSSNFSGLVQLDLSDLSKGLYMVIINNNGKLLTQKLIKE